MSDKEKKSPEKAKASKATPKNDKKANTKSSFQFKRWLTEMKSELAKVQWPSKKDTSKHTITVLGCVGLVGVFIWIYDFLAANVIEALINLT